MKIFFSFLLLLVVIMGCSKLNHQNPQLMSIQLFDRNGFKETITSVDRLKMYQKADFSVSQPYTKVVRIYSRSQEGKTPSRLTTYHKNGEIWQYLEVINGRACGAYREWHANGKLRLELTVIEGLGDLSEDAQMGWIFDGISRVWDDQGCLAAEFNYEKGLIQGTAFYYFPSGKLQQQIPYEKGQIDGDVLFYNQAGHVIGKTTFIQGKEQGISTFRGDETRPPYTETYQNGFLMEGVYHDFTGKIISRIEKGFGKRALFTEGYLQALEEYRAGILEGEMQVYEKNGNLKSSFEMKNGIKQGQECVYYPMCAGREPQPKLCMSWVNDQVHGITRTWFPDGILESEREMHENQKHGVSSAWYVDGTLRLVEEYSHDELISGTYIKRGDSQPISSVEKGTGIVTLYDSDGLFLKRISYEKGRPILDES